MSESVVDPEAATATAADPAAERAIDRSRLKQHARLHGALGLAALTLWGAADAWAVASGWALAQAVALANAVAAAYLLSGILHEWGHFAGARLAGAASPVHPKLVNTFFLFDFPFDRNDTRQFVWMSWGGIATPWLGVLATLLLVPIDNASRAALLAAFVARALAVSLFEGPVVWRAMEGEDPRRELGRRVKQGGLASSFRFGHAAGAGLWLALLAL